MYSVIDRPLLPVESLQLRLLRLCDPSAPPKGAVESPQRVIYEETDSALRPLDAESFAVADRRRGGRHAECMRSRLAVAGGREGGQITRRGDRHPTPLRLARSSISLLRIHGGDRWTGRDTQCSDAQYVEVSASQDHGNRGWSMKVDTLCCQSLLLTSHFEEGRAGKKEGGYSSLCDCSNRMDWVEPGGEQASG